MEFKDKICKSKHLEEIKQGYVEHMKNSLVLSKDLILTGCKIVVHAFIPDLFSTAATDFAKKLNTKLEENKKRKE